MKYSIGNGNGINKKNKDKNIQKDVFITDEGLKRFATYYENSESDIETNETETETETEFEYKVGDSIKYKKEDGKENTTKIKEILPKGDIVTDMNKKNGEPIIIKKETVVEVI